MARPATYLPPRLLSSAVLGFALCFDGHQAGVLGVVVLVRARLQAACNGGVAAGHGADAGGIGPVLRVLGRLFHRLIAVRVGGRTAAKGVGNSVLSCCGFRAAAEINMVAAASVRILTFFILPSHSSVTVPLRMQEQTVMLRKADSCGKKGHGNAAGCSRICWALSGCVRSHDGCAERGYATIDRTQEGRCSAQSKLIPLVSKELRTALLRRASGAMKDRGRRHKFS